LLLGSSCFHKDAGTNFPSGLDLSPALCLTWVRPLG
jgi:hypothetical protein